MSAAPAVDRVSDPAFDIEMGDDMLRKVREGACGFLAVALAMDALADQVGTDLEDPEERHPSVKLALVINARELDTHCASILSALASTDITSKQEVRRRFLGQEDRLVTGGEASELRSLVSKALDQANALLTVGSLVGRDPATFEEMDGLPTAEERDSTIRRDLVLTARALAELSRDVVFVVAREWGAPC